MTQDFDSAGDIRLKGKVMVDLVIISKINLRQQCSAVRKKEVGQLCSIYAATMLKMMKESYIPDFEGWKKETMERKTAAWKRVFDAKWESFLKERNEREEERARKELSIPFKQRMRMRQQTTEEEKKKGSGIAEQDDAYMLEARKEWDKKRNLSNILGSMGGRNSRIRSFLKDGGGGLLQNFIGQLPRQSHRSV